MPNIILSIFLETLVEILCDLYIPVEESLCDVCCWRYLLSAMVEDRRIVDVTIINSEGRMRECESENTIGRDRYLSFFIVKIFSYWLNVDTVVHIYIFCNKHFSLFIQLHFIYKPTRTFTVVNTYCKPPRTITSTTILYLFPTVLQTTIIIYYHVIPSSLLTFSFTS